MREAHAHVFQLGRSLTMLDCSGCDSRQALLELIAERAKSLNTNDWVLAHSARPEAWPDPHWPTRQELDHASDRRAVCIWCFDYHSMAASTAALDHAKITSDTIIDRGTIEPDSDGSPTGVLYEHAALTLWSSVPEPGTTQRRAFVRNACQYLQELGYTEIHDLKAQPWLGHILHDLQSSGQINQRFKLFPLTTDLNETLATSDQWESDQLTLAGTKIFTDGSLNSRTAWMLAPYTDTKTTGTPMMSPQEIDDAMLMSKVHNLPVAAHAIGDAAVRAVLDSIERTGCSHMNARIEHAELIHPDDIPRFAKLGVIASIQPCHLLADIETLNAGLSDRLERVLPMRSLIESGCVPGESLIFGSDVPIVRADHQDSIQAAVRRRRDDMAESHAIGLNQALTIEESLACFKSH